MAVPKSPFKVYEHFLSPKVCEDFINRINFNQPDVNKDGKPIKMFKHNEHIQEVIFSRLQLIVPDLEKYYGFQYKGTEEIMTEWYDAGVTGDPQCENSHYLRNNWVRTRTRDISAVLFLCDYQDNANFDADYEVYGGKLEFPQWGFSFNPIRGTIVFYPSDPHFINATSMVQAGELYQSRIHIASNTPYLFDPNKFPGTFREWFAA